MGSSVSTSANQVQQEVNDKNATPGGTGGTGGGSLATEEEIVALLMPLYYTTEPLTAEEREAAVYVWKLIVKNQCQHFNTYKTMHPERFKTVADFLHITFYERLFEIHPSCRSLFTRDISKMNLIPMVSLCLTKFDDPVGLKRSLANLVNVHNHIGVKAVEYGMAGEVLLHAIKSCVGPSEYTEAAHRGWTKIYSAMLSVMVPEVVKYELTHKSEAQQTLEKRAVMASKSLRSFSDLITKISQSELVPLAAVKDSKDGSNRITQREQSDMVLQDLETRSGETISELNH
eukprot:gene2896-3161_t